MYSSMKKFILILPLCNVSWKAASIAGPTEASNSARASKRAAAADSRTRKKIVNKLLFAFFKIFVKKKKWTCNHEQSTRTIEL